MRKHFKAILAGLLILFIADLVFEAMKEATDSPLSEFVGESGVYRIQYAEVSDELNRDLGRQIQEWGYFEGVAQTLSAAYILPEDVNVIFTECEEANAFYMPDERAIILCYQLMRALDGQFRPFASTEEEVATMVWNTMLFVFYHEAGHSMIDILDLPVTGREEDAVDQLATLILLGTGTEGRDAALQGASWFSFQGTLGAARGAAYWDSHSLSIQRYYNIICWIYGSDPEAHGELLKSWGLPEDRAASCPAEYGRMATAWRTILAEHIREQ